MARGIEQLVGISLGFPHPRGDGPQLSCQAVRYAAISPPAWGWPAVRYAADGQPSDFPTRVGMAREASCVLLGPRRFPHPRGDGPPLGNRQERGPRISPPAWGWPVVMLAPPGNASDFPTRVGMARRMPAFPRHGARFPHPRGDGPLTDGALISLAKISPPAWGWPGGNFRAKAALEDFPTRVGMARIMLNRVPRAIRFPHPRGDGPHGGLDRSCRLSISPPAWGWPERRGGQLRRQ